MPRSSRAVPASSAATAPALKRRVSDRLSAASKLDPKRQKSNSTTVNKSVRSTAKKSKYFEKEDPKQFESESSHVSEVEEDSVSDYEDTNAISSTSEDGDSVISTDEVVTKKSTTKKGKQPGMGKTRERKGDATINDDDVRSSPEGETVTSLKEKELWREGVSTGLGPGKQVFIKKPKARDPGEVPYQDDTLHPNTMLFLKDLTENNERQWLKAHDADYRASKKDWETFVESLNEKISEKDSTIPELPAKDLVFRIHRDIRFSKDPTPYKTHFSAAWSRTGKKGPYAVYYVHCQPGFSFVGSGLWHPEASKVALLREDIDRNSHRLKTLLNEPDMRREFFNGLPDDEEKAVKAFVNQNKESALKTKPKGYDADNENIQLLRLRNFTIGRPLSDSELLGSSAQERIAALIGIMEPFITYLNSVVMPDPVDQDTSSETDSTDLS